MRPRSFCDGYDEPRLLDELVPCVAAVADDIVVVQEDAVREPVVAHELPDVFHRVELGRSSGQGQQGYIVGHPESGRAVPAGLIEDQHGVAAGIDGLTDLLEVLAHRRGLAPWHDKAGPLPLGGAHRAKQIGRHGPLILGGPRSGAPLRPASADCVLLADPRLVLEPQLYAGAAWERRFDRRQPGGEAFLKSSIAASFWPWCCGRADSLRYPSLCNSRPTVVSSRLMRNSS